MTTRDIVSKLTAELDAGIEREVQVVYLLAGIRKLIERDQLRNTYPNLNFHCDWALHAKLDRTDAKGVLRQFDAAHILLRDQRLELHELPSALRVEILRISNLRSFKAEMSSFLEGYGLPPLMRNDSDGWPRFLFLYCCVIEDIPLVVKDENSDEFPNVSKVVVHVDEAPQDIEGEVLFRVRWTIHDRNGGAGDVFTINSFAR